MSHLAFIKKAIFFLVLLDLITTSNGRIPKKFRPPSIKSSEKTEKDYSLLYETYPELSENQYNDCINSISDMIIRWYSNKTQNLNKFSLHYFTELGEINKCENTEGGGSGSYVQIGFTLT